MVLPYLIPSLFLFSLSLYTQASALEGFQYEATGSLLWLGITKLYKIKFWLGKAVTKFQIKAFIRSANDMFSSAQEGTDFRWLVLVKQCVCSYNLFPNARSPMIQTRSLFSWSIYMATLLYPSKMPNVT